MKGIILAGGRGSRLYPITLGTCKQLLPIYDKPMIYYPLSVLMQAHIREILIISTPEDIPRFQRLFNDGSHLGLSIQYAVQEKPEGIAQAFLIAKEFIGEETVALVLGDNIFYGPELSSVLQASQDLESGAIVFGYEVKDPQRYGVLEFASDGRVKKIIEKPVNPPSPYVVTGLYFYDHHVVEIARHLKPSKRGELEITDVNNAYLERGQLHVRLFSRGFAWLDTGTFSALQKASTYVETIQERQGIRIGCVEEIAYQMGYISLEQFEKLISLDNPNEYQDYLIHFLKYVSKRVSIT